jgi:hypothetical protein
VWVAPAGRLRPRALAGRPGLAWEARPLGTGEGRRRAVRQEGQSCLGAAALVLALPRRVSAPQHQGSWLEGKGHSALKLLARW